MASDPNNMQQGGARNKYGQLTPEPSVEPEQLKSVQPTSQTNDENKPRENEPGSSPTGDVGQTASPTSDSLKNGHPTINLEPTDGAAKGNDQRTPGVSDLQAREVDRIMGADPKLAFKVLGLAGLQSKEEAEERYQELVELLSPANCGHPKASDAIKSRCSCARLYKA
jgi:hypothetical protein